MSEFSSPTDGAFSRITPESSCSLDGVNPSEAAPAARLMTVLSASERHHILLFRQRADDDADPAFDVPVRVIAEFAHGREHRFALDAVDAAIVVDDARNRALRHPGPFGDAGGCDVFRHEILPLIQQLPLSIMGRIS